MKDQNIELVVGSKECYISGADSFYEIKSLSDFKLNPIDRSRALYAEDSVLVLSQEVFFSIESILKNHFTNK